MTEEEVNSKKPAGLEAVGSRETDAASGDQDREKLDLAAVAAQLAAKSAQPVSDPAVSGTGSSEPDQSSSTAADPEQFEEDDDDEQEQGDGPELTKGSRQLTGAELYAAVEALLFAADRPVTAAQIARALPQGINAREVRKQLKAIGEELEDAQRGYQLREIAGGWQLLTCERFGEYVTKLRKAAAQRKLSGSALETLAVVAYKQPVNRAEVERIRGVACGDMLRNLMEKRLVKITGRSEELGNPLLYGTTQDFLDYFGLGSISELPRSSELGRKSGKKSASPQSGDEAEEGSGDKAGQGQRAEWIPSASSAQIDRTRDGQEAILEMKEALNTQTETAEPEQLTESEDPVDPDAGDIIEDLPGEAADESREEAVRE